MDVKIYIVWKRKRAIFFGVYYFWNIYLIELSIVIYNYYSFLIFFNNYLRFLGL